MISDNRDAIIAGIATILWGDAWASHADEHGCCNLSGCEVTEYMPIIPDMVTTIAETIGASVEAASGVTLDTLYQRSLFACRSRKRIGAVKCPYGRPRNASHTPERFGECIAWMSQGAGVGWEDDHNAVTGMVVPYSDAYDIRFHADSTCKDDSPRKPCPYCGCYVDPSDSKCRQNCGKAIKWVKGEPRKVRQPKAKVFA